MPPLGVQQSLRSLRESLAPSAACLPLAIVLAGAMVERWTAGMSTDESAHMRWLRRVLRGDVVNNEVGIRLRGGPFDRRIRIVPVDAIGRPPSSVRGRRSERTWHVYALADEPAELSTWIYDYVGQELVECQH